MRITDFPLINEVKEEYIDLRSGGASRDQATQQLIQEYADELTKGADDDGVLFWIGLADGQYARKEITLEVAEQGLKALDLLAESRVPVTPLDINRRREHYSAAPMPERKAGKPRRKFQCNWNVGDTFAYQLTGPEAETAGLGRKYILLRKVDEDDFEDGRLLPIVTVSLWGSDPLPRTAEEFQKVPLLKIRKGGRCDSPKWKNEYRAEMVVKSYKQLASMQLKFLGNFQNIPMPDDEIIFTKPGYIMFLSMEHFERDICVFWKMHQYITQRSS